MTENLQSLYQKKGQLHTRIEVAQSQLKNVNAGIQEYLDLEKTRDEQMAKHNADIDAKAKEKADAKAKDKKKNN